MFYKYGDRIRGRSRLITQMREDQEKSQKRAARARRHHERERVFGDVEKEGVLNMVAEK